MSNNFCKNRPMPRCGFPRHHISSSLSKQNHVLVYHGGVQLSINSSSARSWRARVSLLATPHKQCLPEESELFVVVMIIVKSARVFITAQHQPDVVRCGFAKNRGPRRFCVRHLFDTEKCSCASDSIRQSTRGLMRILAPCSSGNMILLKENLDERGSDSAQLLHPAVDTYRPRLQGQSSRATRIEMCIFRCSRENILSEPFSCVMGHLKGARATMRCVNSVRKFFCLATDPFQTLAQNAQVHECKCTSQLQCTVQYTAAKSQFRRATFSSKSNAAASLKFTALRCRIYSCWKL